MEATPVGREGVPAPRVTKVQHYSISRGTSPSFETALLPHVRLYDTSLPCQIYQNTFPPSHYSDTSERRLSLLLDRLNITGQSQLYLQQPITQAHIRTWRPRPPDGRISLTSKYTNITPLAALSLLCARFFWHVRRDGGISSHTGRGIPLWR